MKYRVHITERAQRDLESAADYIEHTLLTPAAADDLLDAATAQRLPEPAVSHTSQLFNDLTPGY